MASDGKSTDRRTKDEIKAILLEAIKIVFPEDTVDVSDGYRDNIHVMVVSRKFDGRPDQEKQDMIWDPINASDLSEEEKLLISLALPLSPADIK